MSVFRLGKLCDLHVRQHDEKELIPYTEAIMRGDTTQYMLTGSYPMRWIDSKAVWDRERASGDVLFSIYVDHCEDEPCQGKKERFVGICGLHGLRDIYHTAELRILIFDMYSIGKGIGTEACEMLVDYGFKKLHLERIDLGVNGDNLGAIKCYEKAGFKHEGRRPKAIFYNGKHADMVLMGVLPEYLKEVHIEA